ncbi:glycosyltransferase [Cohnella sp. 56]|uniref:glycosyltransferase n=1 Tax=Cohnella sp. 56 TaxID=3113722 RepID=UPI0030EA85FD
MRGNVFVPPSDTSPVRFSVLVPARNEEHYIGKCLDSLEEAAASYQASVEVIVIVNRCTDRTEEIARSYGCVVVQSEERNLSMLRNAGARATRGEVLLTIDADSRVEGPLFSEIDEHLHTGRFVGGGTMTKFERMSLGIACSAIILIVPLLFKYGPVSVGLLWCRKTDFDTIGGFDEAMLMAEDADFASRLKSLGKRSGRKYGTLRKTKMITSCRKFDAGGDWVLVKRPSIVRAYLNGKDTQQAEEAYYGENAPR